MEQLFLETLSQTFHEQQKLLTINASLNKQYTFSRGDKHRERDGEGDKKEIAEKKNKLHCTWFVSQSGGPGMWWRVVGSRQRISPVTLNSLRRTSPALSTLSLQPLSLLPHGHQQTGSLPLKPTAAHNTHRGRGKTEKKISCFGFSSCMMSHPDFVYYVLFISLSV